MIGKVLAAGCLIVSAIIATLSQAIAEPNHRSLREQDFFLIGFILLCVGLVGFSNYLTLKQIWGTEKFYQNSVFQFIGWSGVICMLWGCWNILMNLRADY